jgi:hypothetical protein
LNKDCERMAQSSEPLIEVATINLDRGRLAKKA